MEILYFGFLFQLFVGLALQFLGDVGTGRAGLQEIVSSGFYEFVDYCCYGNPRQNEIDVIDLEATPPPIRARSSQTDSSSRPLDDSCPKRRFVNGITNEDDNEVPSQLRIALAGKDTANNKSLPTGISVMWYLSNKCACSVEYRVVGATSSIEKIPAQSMVQYLHGYGFHYAAFLDKLEAGKDYQYRVGCTCGSELHKAENEAGPEIIDAACRAKRSKIAYSDYIDFQASWAKPQVKLAVFGDHGYLSTAERGRTYLGPKAPFDAKPARDMLLAFANTTDMYWHVGDIAYADDAFLHKPWAFTYENVYSNYMNWMQPFMAGKPYMVTAGNHESECHSIVCVLEFKKGEALRNFTAFNSRWRMPSTESGGVMNMWYSFDYAGAHFISLNSETDWDGAEEEGTGDSHMSFLKAGHFSRRPNEYLDWVESDLANAWARKRAGEITWIIAGSHRPFGDLAPKHDATRMFDMFAKYEVDMHFAGHKHEYGRQNQLYPAPTADTAPFDPTGEGWTWADMRKRHGKSATSGTTTSDRNRTTVLIVSGGAGCDEMAQNGLSRHSDFEKGWYEDSHFSSNYSMGFLTINMTALTWELHDATNGRVVDSVIVTKDQVIEPLKPTDDGSVKSKLGYDKTLQGIFV